MKTNRIIRLLAALALSAGSVIPTFAAPAPKPENVSVTFQDSDNFTDALENHGSTTSAYFLDQLRECIEQAATRRLATGEKLVITVTDVDLAGETRFNQPHEIRIMKEIYAPRVRLKFQLLGADGKGLKEGERNLVDQEYLMNSGRPGSSDPLFYDKLMLKDWITKEFKKSA